MVGSTLGHVFRLTSFGESHGEGIGGIIDGCPSGITLNEDLIQSYLDKRRSGGRNNIDTFISTSRKEEDKVSLLSGVFDGKTTGTPIAFLVHNKAHNSGDYEILSSVYRPGHADISYEAKYGLRDYRGGGRASGRETISRVVGGAIAESILTKLNMHVFAATVELGGINIKQFIDIDNLDISDAESRPFFAAHHAIIDSWEKRAMTVCKAKDSLGGIVRLEVHNVISGLGEPVFQKLDAMLAAALMSVGAVKGVEIGAGFASARMLGSENNDLITSKTPLHFASNNAGGILGGISSGQNIIVHVAVKPIPSIACTQSTITRDGDTVDICIDGRHDICAIPRIVPVLKAMVALTLADAVLMQKRLEVL